MARPKKKLRLKEPIKLREEKLVNGNKSLYKYLDIYLRGTRKYEYLGLYLIPEITPDAKERNKETKKLAEQIKADRLLTLQSQGTGEWETIKKSSMSSMSMIAWLEKDFAECLHIKNQSS